MILIDNKNALRHRFRPLLDMMTHLEQSGGLNNNIQVINAKNGQSTLQYEKENQSVYIHSKYDPMQEAERLVSQFSDLGNYKHIFFYGIGLGYHVELLMKQHPNVPFTVYEPNPTTFYHYLANSKIDRLPIRMLKYLFIETDNEVSKVFLQKFALSVKDEVLLVILPSYERIFVQQTNTFKKQFKEAVKASRFNLHANYRFEKLWTINSIQNIKEIVRTPNVLHDIDKEKVKDKPVILVAAGPSLNEELDNIRKIIDEDLAYVIAVGTGFKVLIKNGIKPHAVTAYDPLPGTAKTFEELIEQEDNDIPLIFGSSVGYLAVENYNGPLLHMLVNKDKVAPYYLTSQTYKNLDYIEDAPSIAVITLQLVYKLGFNPIILTGQNLAYKDGEYYAKGGHYNKEQEEILKKRIIDDKNHLVEDVHGNMIMTNNSFNNMRRSLEYKIKSFKESTIVNTTKGGAKIAGAPFVTLEEIIDTKLTSKVVDNNWLKTNNQYSTVQIKEQCQQMNLHFVQFKEIEGRLIGALKQLETQIAREDSREIQKALIKLFKAFKKLKTNHFYKVFILPMNIVQYEVMAKTIGQVKHDFDQVKKGKEIFNSFINFIGNCQKDIEYVLPLYKRMQDNLLQEVNS